MPLDRPIPAFYCCYLLRSTVRRSRLYVGSTPKPSIRLKQHNGIIKGGAAKTSRDNWRPWEMTAIVTGFPSQIAALQFEWAWQNPHLTHHIPADSRIAISTAKKKSGQPKRPRYSLDFLLSNLHLLLRVPSFSRWPLELRFFSQDVHQAWVRSSSQAIDKLRSTLPILLDFPGGPNFGTGASEQQESSHSSNRITDLPCPSNQALAALEVDYSNHKAHFEKSKSIVDFEVEGSCSICSEDLVHDGGIYVVCPHKHCKSVSHLTCLSRHFLASDNRLKVDEDEEDLVPVKGNCPSCGGALRWIDVVKETTLRMRGDKEAEKLMRRPRTKVMKGSTTSGKGAKGETIIPALSDVEVDDLADDYDWADELDAGEDDAKFGESLDTGGRWHTIDDFNIDDDDTISMTSEVSTVGLQSPERWKSKGQRLDIVIEDSDWDEADVLE